MREIPPILKGSEAEQLGALRDYLVRLSRRLEEAATAAEAATSAAAASTAESRASTAAVAADAAAARTRSAGELRSLILKSADSTAARINEQADTVQQNLDRLDARLREDYLAVADFDRYTLAAELSMSATARSVVESYGLVSAVESATAQGELLSRYVSSLRGEIRRGVLTDPETGEEVLGIAVAERLSFTGETVENGGLTYYRLSPGQTLGLYTARGWQFWLGGVKRGWFDSADGMLHLRRAVVEESLDLGADWSWCSVAGLGLRYTGV